MTAKPLHNATTRIGTADKVRLILGAPDDTRHLLEALDAAGEPRRIAEQTIRAQDAQYRQSMALVALGEALERVSDRADDTANGLANLKTHCDGTMSGEKTACRHIDRLKSEVKDWISDLKLQAMGGLLARIVVPIVVGVAVAVLVVKLK